MYLVSRVFGHLAGHPLSVNTYFADVIAPYSVEGIQGFQGQRSMSKTAQ